MVDYIVFSQQIMKTSSTMHYVDNFMQAVYWKMNTINWSCSFQIAGDW